MLGNYVLLITGCINPDIDVPFLKITDYEYRRTEYIDSIKYYIEETNIKKIVFCDNSAENEPKELCELARRKSKQFEWLSFQGNNAKAVEQGKGYGEGEIIEYALKNSSLLKESKYFIKVTGRVKVRNIDCLLFFMKNSHLYFVRNSPFNVDTKVYGIPSEVYKKFFLYAFKEVDDIEGIYLEHLFSEVIVKNQLKIHNFVVFPNVQGISGSTGITYSVSLKRRIWLTIKSYIQKT